MRFRKQELFREIGEKGQRALGTKHVTIVGCGALGSVAAELLVRAGIGRLTLVDRDFIELSNLQRQGLYRECDIGGLKALVLAARLKEIDSSLRVDAFAVDLDVEDVSLLGADLVLDCTDNFYTRFLVNEFCVQKRVPWVFASAVGSSGMVVPFVPKGPCFRCVFSEPQVPLGSCDTEGVLNTVVHVVSAMQVTEGLKLLLGKKVSQELLSVNVWSGAFVRAKVRRRKGCPVCGGRFDFLSGKEKQGMVKMCGAELFQVKGKGYDFKALEKRLSKVGEVRSGSHCLFFKELAVFRDGRVLVRAKSEAAAKSLVARYLG